MCNLLGGNMYQGRSALLFVYLSAISVLLSRCDDCINHFCPPGTFCDERVGPCKTPPCRPILLCIPDQYNGCARHSCPSGEICVERVRSCIGKSCKKIPSCAKPGTCDALVCPPSQKCVAEPTPKCVKHIPTVTSVIGGAHLAPGQ